MQIIVILITIHIFRKKTFSQCDILNNNFKYTLIKFQGSPSVFEKQKNVLMSMAHIIGKKTLSQCNMLNDKKNLPLYQFSIKRLDQTVNHEN